MLSSISPNVLVFLLSAILTKEITHSIFLETTSALWIVPGFGFCYSFRKVPGVFHKYLNVLNVLSVLMSMFCHVDRRQMYYPPPK